jgi:hypothetical protein
VDGSPPPRRLGPVTRLVESVVVPFEWIEEGKLYREFLVRAEDLNRYPITGVAADPVTRKRVAERSGIAQNPASPLKLRTPTLRFPAPPE